jgi:hypothetical protein
MDLVETEATNDCAVEDLQQFNPPTEEYCETVIIQQWCHYKSKWILLGAVKKQRIVKTKKVFMCIVVTVVFQSV